MNVDELVRQWFSRVHRMQIAHYDAAVHFERLNLLFGIPVVVLATVVGTTIFATISKSPSTVIQICAGLMSVAAAVLASLQTFLRYGERSEKHKNAGAKYAGLKTEFELVLALPEKDEAQMKEFLESFRARWTAVHEDSPTVSEDIFVRATLKVRSSLSGTSYEQLPE
jgi:hypothetical protein